MSTVTATEPKQITVDGRKLTGPEEIRLLESNMSVCREGFIEKFTAVQLIQLGRMLLASGWDMCMDTWTPRQVREALKGKPPKWDDKERPSYAGGQEIAREPVKRKRKPAKSTGDGT